MRKFFVDGREIRQIVVSGAIESLFDCIDALKNGGNNKYSAKLIAGIKSDQTRYNNFLIFPANNALRGIESEFNTYFRNQIVKIKSGEQTITIHIKGGIARRVEF